MSYFSYVGKLFTNVKGFYNEINAATLTGSIDVVIVQQDDGTFLSSPFHVRFGKLGVLRAREKVVDVEINGKSVGLQMKLGDSGEAFFVTDLDVPPEELPSYLATSPIPSSGDLMEDGVKEMKAKYLNVEDDNHLSTSDVRIQIEEQQEDHKEKRRKKKRLIKKKGTVKEESRTATEGKDGDIPMFDMEDVSSDEELANLPPMPSLHSMGKSVSLPVMDEEDSLQRTSDWASTQYDRSYNYLHPFSDTDMSPMNSPPNTRPPSPTKSDTELNKHRRQDAESSFLSEDDNTMWEWGDLPRKSELDTPNYVGKSKSTETALATPGIKVQGQSNVKQSSGGLFHFMRKSKHVRHKPEAEGIYLDDLKVDDMDPEIAKLYFPKRFTQAPFVSIKDKDEDAESGRGASLPVSPHSVEGAIGGPPVSFLQSEVKHLGMFSMSLCGGLTDPDGVTLEKFMQNVVTFDDLCDNYTMINNPDLVIRIDETFYNWPTAAPIILSRVVFDRDLKETAKNTIIRDNMPKKKESKKSGGVTSWFSWRRTADMPQSKMDTPPTLSGPLNVTSDTEVSTANITQSDISLSPPCSNPASASGTPRKQRQRKTTSESLKADDEHTSSEADTESDKGIRMDMFKKTLRLNSEQIKSLNLKDGMNEVTFSVTTQFQGTTKCTSHIYLWNWNDKIVVSDIDGTITKSDVLGQILPIIGKDWSQTGVAQLYTNIESNGYKFLYLSARAIGQSRVTKDLLKSIKQQYHVLPDGPLLLSPTSLVSAFHREVIEKKPEEFKIACLKDIASLFSNPNVFYAGFGNKINDVYAYKALNIPPYRIFTINHRGELKQESAYTFQSSYFNLSDVVDHFFPPLHLKSGMVATEFNASNYWRDPLPPVRQTDIVSLTEPDPRREKL